MPLLPNQILNNRYLIQALLGQGGMGSVYRAFDQVLQRPVAIKEHIPDPNATPQGLAQARAQFQREARVLAKLHHDNLPRVTDYFSFGGNEYLVMDLIEGMGLDQVVQHHGAISEGAVRAWMNQVLDALIYIHSQNPPVIHRDIKPANLILKPDGKVVLVDFGLVKLLDPNNPRTLSAMRAMGTPEYAPIEQFSPGMHTDARSDIYSLGATMYHLLSGRPPLDVPRRLVDPTQMPNLRAINPNISPQMEWVVHKALEIQPQNRFQSAAEMKQALATTATVPAPPQPPSPPYVPPPPPPPRQKSAPRFPVLAGIAGAVVVLLCVVLAIAVMARQPNSVAMAPTSTTVASASPTAVPTAAAVAVPTARPTVAPTATPLVIVVTATPIPTPTATATPPGPQKRLDAVYAGRDASAVEIFDLNTGSRSPFHPVAQGQFISSAVWSRDGKKMLIAWFELQERWLGYGGGGIQSMMVDSSGKEIIAIPGRSSPDPWKGWIVSVMKYFNDAVWSPDQQKIAVFGANTADDRCPSLLDTRTLALNKLPFCEAYDYPRYWSVDGKWIIARSERGLKLYAYEVDGNRRVPLEQLGKIQVYDQRYWPWRVTDAPVCKGASFWECE